MSGRPAALPARLQLLLDSDQFTPDAVGLSLYHAGRPAEQPLLFACENDHGAVTLMAKELEGRVKVVDCMVDRVCIGRTIRPEGVAITAEPWNGSIVCLEPGLPREAVPFSAEVADVPACRREAGYYSERKLSLVNGMHTVLAFMTIDKQWIGNDGGKEYVLLKYERMHRDNQRVCEAWRTARVAALLQEFGEPSPSHSPTHRQEYHP